MRVLVDRNLCEANGICERLAGAVFRLDERDRLHVRVEVLADEQLADVREAIRRCPKQALRLAE
ncbi:ferredoxin [Nannocystaceae bacterium ST9]